MQSTEKATHGLEVPAPGAGMKDLLPIPATDPADTNEPGREEPTLSHKLAVEAQGAPHREAVQQPQPDGLVNHDRDRREQGVVAPVVDGMENEELWMLIRRFNKQIYDVRATPYPPPGGLDLNVADDEEFSPDKLRANVERLYMTLGVGLLAAVKHVARLRSWRETRRTACFAAAYFVAWLLDVLVPLISGVLIALIGFPQTRKILFPPAPVALIDSETGGVQKPKAGVLGSHDSATGAPEHHRGEAVEEEASNFVSGIASVALSSAAGKHPQGDPDEGENAATEAAPDPTALATSTLDAKEKASGSKAGTKHDKTKQPMEAVIWTKMRPIMHTMSTVADTWERLANALSPIPLFPTEVFRLRLVGVLLPLVFGVSLFVTPYMFLKAGSFFFGFIFFGDPVISRGLAWLNRTIPDWPKMLEPRNTILKGVPTNAQLTLTLLRMGEARHSPLPPPPHNTSPPPSKPAPVDLHNPGDDDGDQAAQGTNHFPSTLNASPSELEAAIAPDQTTPEEPPHPPQEDITAARDPKHGKRGSKILNLFKGTTRGAVKTAVGTDTLRAKAGSQPARDRLGVIPHHRHHGHRHGHGGHGSPDPNAEAHQGDGKAEKVTHASDATDHRGAPTATPRSDPTSKPKPPTGPVEFEARYEGEKGRVIVSGFGSGTVPVVAFAKGDRSGTVQIAGEEREDVRAAWSVPVEDIAGLKKIGGYGWKAKLVVGWSMDREVKDGLVITTRDGTELKVTAVPQRDELFNRLVAMGGQKWVAW